jgi:predicted RNA-binding Zn-ribbon protein involved in translation (DUF1610 family)
LHAHTLLAGPDVPSARNENRAKPRHSSTSPPLFAQIGLIVTKKRWLLAIPELSSALMGSGEPFGSFSAGTLAGAGCFRCESCGFAVALHECDEVPDCPHCGGEEFKRSSIFGELSVAEPSGPNEVEHPGWLRETRDALDPVGDYMAFDVDGQVRVVSLGKDWTRIGRSLSADIRFDDPTVSRRHAMVHRQEGNVRILDDRSLNGVFVNGERTDMSQLEDGDELTIGRFRLYFLSFEGGSSSAGGRPEVGSVPA